MSVFVRSNFCLGKRLRFFVKLNAYLPSYPGTRFKTYTMKYLNVAEKNDAAKNIAIHLSRGTSCRREGLSKFNKIYEFEAEVMGQKSQMVMTSVSGHLLGLEFVQSFKNWQSCSPLSLFDAEVYKHCPENYKKIKETLEREIRSCQGLIIWTDCDREGENIGFEIISVCTQVKNNLLIYRAKFSEITSVSVQRALRNLERPNKNISDAVDVRQELDLRIGAAFTRLHTMRLQKVFPTQLSERIISYGSCQFPTMGFVVERYRAIENFVVEEFWKIAVNHTINNLTVNFTWERGRLFDHQTCQVLHSIVTENPLAKVVKVDTHPKSKWRPLPLDTVELEKLASRKLKFSAKTTMEIAEKLYSQGLISYPRTETNQFPKEINLTNLVQLHTGDAQWGSFAQRILDDGGPTPRQGKKTDMAHPPIHPIKHTSSLPENELRLYQFIVRSFLACCSKDAQGKETTVNIDIAKEIFSASGLLITDRNYLDVYPYDKWSSTEIHAYEVGQTFTPSNIGMVEGATSPPNLLTEADLIALMEKHGIGTDATHADHIEKIKIRLYVTEQGGYLSPSVLGMGLVEGYDAMELDMSKPHRRAQLEADLKAISEERKQPREVLDEQIKNYKEAFIRVEKEAKKIDEALGIRFQAQPSEYNPTTPFSPKTAFRCPKCDSDMTLRQIKNKQEFYIGCSSFPVCKNAVWLSDKIKKVEVLTETCQNCGPGFHKLKLEWLKYSLSHIYPSPFVACLGCDVTLREYLSIRISSVKKTPGATNGVISTSNSSSGSSGVGNETSSTRSISSNTLSRDNPPSNHGPRGQNSNTNVTSNAQPRQNASSFVAPGGQSAGTSRMPFPRTNSNAFPTTNNISEDNMIVCLCNEPAKLLTVRKAGANQGRQFYKCNIGMDNGGCDFFAWSSPPNETNPSDGPSSSNSTWGVSVQSSYGGGSRQVRGSLNSEQNDSEETCNCSIPCRVITVRKEGPNKGRSFYGCANQITSRCNFFKWADGEGNNNNCSTEKRVHGARGGRGAARASGFTSGAPRLCSLCRQSGHTRNRCPQRQPTPD